MSKKALTVVNANESKDLALADITKLQMVDSFKKIIDTMPEHEQMLEVIRDNLPEVHRASSLFMKTQSQFMDNMMTVSAYTPIRNLRQLLAEMVRTRDAIKEAHFRLRKKEVELRTKQKELSKEKSKKRPDQEKLDLLKIEIQEILDNAETTNGYISGAIRKLTNHTEEYNMILKSHNLENFTEEDFEREEERYHIMKAFEQAICAARARGGMIDEGNMIYLTQIGINGAHAQYRLTEFFKQEQALLNEGKAPTHKAYLDFLEKMVQEFQGSAEKFAQAKGMSVMTKTALIQKGDTRLLLESKPKKK